MKRVVVSSSVQARNERGVGGLAGLRMYVEFYENAEIISEPLRATNIILNLPCGPIRISKCLLPKKNERIS